MGRLTTYIAGRASSADKLPGQLPNVSLIDALLPRIIYGRSSSRRTLVSLVDSVTGQPLDRGSSRGSVTHTDVRKDKKGQLALIQHRDKSAGARSGGGGQATLQDVKKDVDAADGGKDGEKKDGSEEQNPFKFSPEEDAELNKMKADEPTMQWASVGEKLKRPGEEAKTRFAELKKLAKAPSGDAKGDSKQNESKQTGGKDNKEEPKPQRGEWTAAEDALIIELMGKGENGKNIAARLEGRTRSDVAKRMGYLRLQEGGKSKNEGENKDKPDREVKEGGGEGQQNGGKKSKKQKRDEKEKEEQSKAKQENAPKNKESKSKTPSKAGSKAGSKARSCRSEAKFTMGEWMTLQEDDMFSFRELQLLSELIITDANESWDGVYSWLRVASLFADRTGRRVHPEDIREKFEAMARD